MEEKKEQKIKNVIILIAKILCTFMGQIHYFLFEFEYTGNLNNIIGQYLYQCLVYNDRIFDYYSQLIIIILDWDIKKNIKHAKQYHFMYWIYYHLSVHPYISKMSLWLDIHTPKDRDFIIKSETHFGSFALKRWTGLQIMMYIYQQLISTECHVTQVKEDKKK